MGSNLAQHLISTKPRQLILLDAMLPLYGGNFKNIENIRELVETEVADIRNVDVLRKIVPETDILFHFASQTSHIDSMTDPFLDVDINCRGNITLLEACRSLAPDARIVYIGTRSQYGPAEYIPVDEKHPQNPPDIYSVNKQAGEWYHFIYHKRYGIPVTSLRLSNVFGPRHQMKHNRYGILNWFIRLAMDNDEIPIYGDGKQGRDYLYVDDVVNAILAAGESKNTIGEVYNVGNIESISLIDSATQIVKTAKSGTIRFIPWPEDREKIEVGMISSSSQKLYETVGWKPCVSFQDGLLKTIEFYLEHKEHYWQSRG